MLTDKQEKFCLNIVSGMNQTDAYKNSYDAENMTDDVIYVKASELMKNGKVKVRIEELRKEARKDTIMSTIQKKEWLTNMINDNEATRNEKLKALDILNKMDGEYIEKIKVSGELSYEKTIREVVDENEY